jgi:hypothetical protein
MIPAALSSSTFLEIRAEGARARVHVAVEVAVRAVGPLGYADHLLDRLARGLLERRGGLPAEDAEYVGHHDPHVAAGERRHVILVPERLVGEDRLLIEYQLAVVLHNLVPPGVGEVVRPVPAGVGRRDLGQEVEAVVAEVHA